LISIASKTFTSVLRYFRFINPKSKIQIPKIF
jgi:hypothetical protein